jgi:hypothetical protein
MKQPSITIVCKARDLKAALEESIRQVVHQQLDELIAGSQRVTLTEKGWGK